MFTKRNTRHETGEKQVTSLSAAVGFPADFGLTFSRVAQTSQETVFAVPARTAPFVFWIFSTGTVILRQLPLESLESLIFTGIPIRVELGTSKRSLVLAIVQSAMLLKLFNRLLEFDRVP